MKLIPIWAALLIASSVFGQTDSQLRYACKQFVERTLHDPRDAELQWTEATVYLADKAGNHIVRFKGRARNQFGALRLSTFECRIRYRAPDKFVAVSVKALD